MESGTTKSDVLVAFNNWQKRDIEKLKAMQEKIERQRSIFGVIAFLLIISGLIIAAVFLPKCKETQTGKPAKQTEMTIVIDDTPIDF